MGRVSCAAGAVAMMAGSLVLLGWALNIDELRSVVPGLATMKINTALGLLCCGLALFLKSIYHLRFAKTLAATNADHTGALIGTITSLFALLTLSQDIFGINLRIDQLFGMDPFTAAPRPPGRMSIATATCLTLLGAAIALLDRMPRTSQLLSMLVLLISTLAVLGYAYGVESLYKMLPFSTMAIHTASGLWILSFGTLLSRPQQCVHRLFTANTVGGKIARRLLPGALLVPLIVGVYCRAGSRLNLYPEEFQLAVFALCTVVMLAALIWWNAKLLDRSDQRRQHLEADRDQVLALEQTARQSAERAIKARDQLLAVFSHELRTPLTPALLLITSLQKRAASMPEDIQLDLDIIHNNIRDQVMQVNRLMDYVGLKQGTISLHRVTNDLHALVREAAAWVETPFREKSITFTTELNATKTGVDVDSRRIVQSIQTLLSNALKFTREGGCVVLRTFDAPDGKVGFELVDTGIGIQAEMMEQIFTAFEHTNAPLSQRVSGMRIGLSLARAIVELQGGTLTARSEGRDKGATLTLLIPLSSADAAERQRGSTPMEQLKLLVVEDNTDALKAMEALLRAAGHNVTSAASAEEAIDIARSSKIDLIISDIGLPDMSGWEMMRQIRSKRPISGIAVSGFVSDEDQRKSLDAGYALHLSKPIDMQRLHDAIHSTRAERLRDDNV
jgi:signal transduction histidine kinase/CheY-like chemotaxis protein